MKTVRSWRRLWDIQDEKGNDICLHLECRQEANWHLGNWKRSCNFTYRLDEVLEGLTRLEACLNQIDKDRFCLVLERSGLLEQPEFLKLKIEMTEEVQFYHLLNRKLQQPLPLWQKCAKMKLGTKTESSETELLIILRLQVDNSNWINIVY